MINGHRLEDNYDNAIERHVREVGAVGICWCD